MRIRPFFLALIAVLLVGAPSAAQDFHLKRASSQQVQREVEKKDANVKVINFWATWCGPCRVEFPELIRFSRDYADKGVTVTFVSLDNVQRETAILRFLQKQGVKGTTYVKKGSSRAFMKAFSKKWNGALPSTLVYGPNGEKQAFWQGRVTYDKLEHRVTDLLSNQ